MKRSGIADLRGDLCGLIADSRMNWLKHPTLLENQYRVMDMHAGAVLADNGVFQFVPVIPVVHVINHVHCKSEDIAFRSIPSAKASPVGRVQVFDYIYSTITQMGEEILQCNWDMIHLVTTVVHNYVYTPISLTTDSKKP